MTNQPEPQCSYCDSFNVEIDIDNEGLEVKTCLDCLNDNIVDRLRERLKIDTSGRFSSYNISTHYSKCWHMHTLCALSRAIDHIEDQQDKIEQLYKEVNDLRLQIVYLSLPKEARRG